MPDLNLRLSLASRSRSLRTRANAFMEQLHDAGLKAMLKVSVLHPLDDVDSLFLGDPDNQPSVDAHEDMWLSNTDAVLAMAEREFERLKNLIAKYGGTESARTTA